MTATVATLRARGRSRSTTAASSTDASVDSVPEGTNLVVVRGVVRRDPVERVLPSGDALLSMDLTVRPVEGAADSVPVVWFDPPAAASKVVEGVDVVVVGRVRRRFFRAAGATASRTEIEADRVVPVSSRTRVATALRSALVDLDLD